MAGRMIVVRAVQRLPASPLCTSGRRALCTCTAPLVESEVLKKGNKPRVVVLGTGWAGFKLIKDIDASKWDVVVISPRNYFLFTPYLTAAAVGTLEFRGITEPVRGVQPNEIRYLQASCETIDTERKQLRVKDVYARRTDDNQPTGQLEYVVPYDYLVVGVGAQTNTFNIPGVTEYCYFLRDIGDARRIRRRIIECFERASSPLVGYDERKRLLHFLVVGGGPVSVEFAAEVHDFIVQDVQRFFPELEPFISITLVEATNAILGGFSRRLSDYTMRLFKKRKIEVLTNVTVSEIKPHSVLLSSGDQIRYGTAVWSTGNAPIRLIDSLPWEKDRGRVLVNDKLKVPGLDDVFCIGDCSVIEGHPLPPTAQVAQQQGRYVAHHLNKVAINEDAPPFKFLYKGMMSYIGGSKAVVDLPIPFARFGGLAAFAFWNSVYLTTLVSLPNKILLPMMWFKSKMFGRDISRFE